MPEIKIDLDMDPEEIKIAVTKAVADSLIGDQIRENIEKQLSKLDYSWDSPIAKIVEAQIKEALANVIHNEYQEIIKQKVAEKVTTEFIGELFTKLWENFKTRY